MTEVFDELTDRSAAGGRFPGVVVGVVTTTDDPLRLGRVKVALPWLAAGAVSNWARVASPMAGPERGVYLLPEVGDEVLVAFAHGSPDEPYVLGGLWSAADRPPVPGGDGRGDVRTIVSRSGHRIALVDAEGSERIEILDPKGNGVVVDTAGKKVTITAAGDVEITATGALRLSGTGVEITSRAGLAVEATGTLDVKGSRVNIN